MLPPERELAERLGVSRATLREAIAALREAGMVAYDARPGRRHGRVLRARRPRLARAARRAARTASEHLLDALVFRRVVEPGACHVAGEPGR